jgi:hypothetical protein
MGATFMKLGRAPTTLITLSIQTGVSNKRLGLEPDYPRAAVPPDVSVQRVASINYQ